MAEWSNAHDSKSCYVGTRTEVRILFSAPKWRRTVHCPPPFCCVLIKEEDSRGEVRAGASSLRAEVDIRDMLSRKPNSGHPLFAGASPLKGRILFSAP